MFLFGEGVQFSEIQSQKAPDPLVSDDVSVVIYRYVRREAENFEPWQNPIWPLHH